MKIDPASATRSVERATAQLTGGQRLVRMTVKGPSGTRSEMLPSDPKQVAKILKERKSKTPAAKVRVKITADLRKRGL